MALTVRTGPFGSIRPPARWWHGGDEVATAFYTTLSLAFPPGERFFVETLTEVAAGLAPDLRRQVRDFARQEANHAREHRRFNRTLALAGHRTAELERRFEQTIECARPHAPLVRVAFTAALEHLTAILARCVLRHPASLAGAPEDIRRFWRWHAVEELEHKSVAFDVFATMAAPMTPLRRWQFRARALGVATRVIASYALASRSLLPKAGPSGWGNARLCWFLFVRPGLCRHCWGDWLAFFRPGFHPSRTDDAGLLQAAEPELRG